MRITKRFSDLNRGVIRTGTSIVGDATPYNEAGHSYQPIGPDLTLAPGAGSNDGTNPKFLAAIMGNVLLQDAIDEFSENYVADATANTLAITAHGLTSGDGPFELIAGSGVIPTGLSADTPYWVIVVDDDTLQLALSAADALAGSAVDFSTAGTAHGTRLLERSARMMGAGNYLAGVIGGYSLTGTDLSEYPTGALLGILFDGGQCDAIVMSVLDGDDGGAATNARAFFGISVNNNNAQSSVDYGMDLYAASNANYSGGGLTSAEIIGKASIRFPNGTWLVMLDTAITANSTTTDAPAGSIGYTNHATGVGKAFTADAGGKWQYVGVA